MTDNTHETASSDPDVPITDLLEESDTDPDHEEYPTSGSRRQPAGSQPNDGSPSERKSTASPTDHRSTDKPNSDESVDTDISGSDLQDLESLFGDPIGDRDRNDQTAGSDTVLSPPDENTGDPSPTGTEYDDLWLDVPTSTDINRSQAHHSRPRHSQNESVASTQDLSDTSTLPVSAESSRSSPGSTEHSLLPVLSSDNELLPVGTASSSTDSTNSIVSRFTDGCRAVLSRISSVRSNSAATDTEDATTTGAANNDARQSQEQTTASATDNEHRRTDIGDTSAVDDEPLDQGDSHSDDPASDNESSAGTADDLGLSQPQSDSDIPYSDEDIPSTYPVTRSALFEVIADTVAKIIMLPLVLLLLIGTFIGWVIYKLTPIIMGLSVLLLATSIAVTWFAPGQIFDTYTFKRRFMFTVVCVLLFGGTAVVSAIINQGLKTLARRYNALEDRKNAS